MRKVKKILVILFLVIISLFTIMYLRYNVSYGNSIFEKSMMIGCMHRALSDFNYSSSKKTCECVISKLRNNYTEEEIKKNSDQIIKNSKSIFIDCTKKFSKNNSTIKQNRKLYEYFSLPDTIHKEVKIDTFSYYYKLSDTVIQDKNDYRFMTVYSKLFRTEKECKKELNLAESDTTYAESHSFNDTLNCPIYFLNKPESGNYYIKAKVKIQSLAAYYGKKDSTGGKMITREFEFYKPLVIE
ncbi:hypothetical protein [Mesonia sp. K4-1]|uniref:hypothetical protein n=1 Tax=Mesonia sp. K4-1 TaxID=2602760 RepID=UPI0011CA421E|nr:hypothetical protein [Mesonia sp. K4-1]TXK80358.1 hypothetical protein FT986_00080 [Mesonia sp. K4-1]